MPSVDITGQRFVRWTVIERAPSRGQSSYWRCRCDCGVIKEVYAGNLRQHKSQSCGCLIAETTSARNHRHGQAKTREYRIWAGMRKRCYGPATNETFKNYGGRGITVSQEWESFATFYADMGPRPPHYTLERIDNNGPYCKENCRWASRNEQGQNTRRNRRLTLHGETLTLTEWAKRIGARPQVLTKRLARGWTEEAAVYTPLISQRRSV